MRKKRGLLLLVAIIAMLVLAACSGGKGEKAIVQKNLAKLEVR